VTTQTLDRTAFTLDYSAYAAQRADARAQMIGVRRERRVRLGDQLALEFENAETLRYQVQEMLYTEAIRDESEVEHEIETYARLLPTSHELCATLVIELDDLATVRAELRRLRGIQNRVAIEVGGERVAGVELPGLEETDDERETVSVHMLRFRFTDAQRDAFRDSTVPAELVVDHPAYSDAEPLTGVTRMRLLADLALETG
jgi:Protein of unknown function (DUF3501)